MKKNWSRFHNTLKIGLILLITGTSPLLVIVGLDQLGVIDAGNAMGPGILAMLTFWPSIILIIIGSILTFKKRKQEIKS
jgi:hypothetical protein